MYRSPSPLLLASDQYLVLLEKGLVHDPRRTFNNLIDPTAMPHGLISFLVREHGLSLHSMGQWIIAHYNNDTLIKGAAFNR